MIAILAWLAAAIAAAILASLFVPVHWVITAGTEDGIRVRARWLFGVVRTGFDSSLRAEAPNEPSRERTSVRGARLVRRLLAIDGLAGRLAMLVVESVRSLGWQRGRIFLRFGLEDPADTGELYGILVPALAVLPRPPGLSVEFQPEFAGSRFEAEAKGLGRLVPARAVVALGRFALSRPGRRFIAVMLWDRGR